MRSSRIQLRCNRIASPTTDLVRAGRGIVLDACLIALFLILFSVSTAFADDQARRLVALLDYLASDYKNAVQDGKVISQDEYEEMQEFSKRALELLKQLKEIDKTDKAGIEPAVKSLVL